MRSEDIFSNIDDRTAERLSEEYPVLDEKRKARLYAMSKRKFDMDNVPETELTEVSGVEKYNRPRWYKGASIAAAAVLLVAGIGTSTVLISRNGKGPAAQVSEVTSAQVAENTALTSAAAVAATEATTEAAVDPEAIAKELTDAYAEFLSDLHGGAIEVDKENIVIKKYPYEGDGWKCKEYYRVTDKKYLKWADVEKRCFEIFDTELGKLILENCNCVDEADLEFDGAMYKTSDGLYIERSIFDDNNGIVNWDQENVTGILKPDGTISTTLTRTVTTTESPYTLKVDFTFVNTENGWRISEVDEKILNDENTDPEAVAKKLIKGYVTLGVDLNSIECDNTVYIENSNPNYTKRFYKVTDKKYSKWEDIEKAYYEIYDKATADQMLENEHCCGEDNITDNTIYLTTDNGFYVEDTSNNLLLNPEEDKYDFNCSLTPEGEIICLCTYTYSGVECEYSGTTKYTIISTENGWRIANAELQTE